MHEIMGPSHGQVLAIPTVKNKLSDKSEFPNHSAALVMHTGSAIDYLANRSHHPKKFTDEPETPHASLFAFLDMPSDPNKVVRFIQYKKKLPRPLIVQTDQTVSLSPFALNLEFEQEPTRPGTPEIASGIKLQPLLEILAQKVAYAEAQDIKQTLRPNFEVAFLARSRFSPAVDQTKTVRRSSDDGLSRRTKNYLRKKGITDADLERCAHDLLQDGYITVMRDGLAQSNLAQIYTAIKHSNRKKRDVYESLHFYHALYAKYLDLVATKFAGSPATAQDLIQEMHEHATLHIDVPAHMEDEHAQAALSTHIGERLSLEQAAAVLKKLPHHVKAASPVLQLYEVMVASAGYTLYSQEESPIAPPFARGSDYLATTSAWPDLVVGAVNKDSATWHRMIAYERIANAHRGTLEDDEVIAMLDQRLQRLFNGHLLNFRAYRNGDAQILHTFLSGLALETPESQMMFYERKAKLMYDDRNINHASRSLLDDNEDGQLVAETILFNAKATIEDKNQKAFGIRDNAFAIVQLIQLYNNLWQLQEVRSQQQHPRLNWRKAADSRGVEMYYPTFKLGSSGFGREFYARVGTSFGITIRDHGELLSDANIAEIVQEVGSVITDRLRGTDNHRRIRNATPLRVAA